MIANLINTLIILVIIAISAMILESYSQINKVKDNCCQAEFNFKQNKTSSDKLFKPKF